MIKLWLTKPEVFSEIQKEQGKKFSFEIPGITPYERLVKKIKDEYSETSNVEKQLKAKKYRDAVGGSDVFKNLLKTQGPTGSFTNIPQKDVSEPSHISLEDLDVSE